MSRPSKLRSLEGVAAGKRLQPGHEPGAGGQELATIVLSCFSCEAEPFFGRDTFK